MSAIAGIWSFQGSVPSVDWLAMLEALKPYGADRCVQYASPSVCLGACSSCLLPEDQFDHQPLTADGVTALVADIRLDNREELALELGLARQRAATMADGDLLLAAWQRWGEQCLTHLLGAFTFAVWNQQEQSLFLARDQMGERPLFYATGANCFAFASMPKGLHPLSFVGSEVDEDYVARYLALANNSPDQSIFRNMRCLPAGSALSMQRGKTRLWHYWQTEQLAELRLGSPEAYLDCFRSLFDQAVRARIRTRGGVGAYLSGGLDSGSVAATAAGLLAADGREISCFTAVPRPGFAGLRDSATHFGNEGEAAAEVAALYPNMRHAWVESSATSFLDAIDRSNYLYDYPCYGPSNEVWSHAIMTQARASGITVLLSGASGNATLSYEGLSALSSWFRSGQWLTLARVASQLRRSHSVSARTMLRQAVWPSLPWWLRRLTDPHLRGFSLDHTVLHPNVIRRLDLERVAFRDLNQTARDGRTLLRSQLASGDMSETHIASQGGWQLDYRDPTYDRRVVEFCLTVPLEEFLRGGQLRSLVRRAMVGRLPASTLRRTMRGRQSADWYINMGAIRPRMAAEVERLERSPLAGRVLDLKRMRWLIDHWPADGFEHGDVSGTYHIGLTRGFSVGRFLLQHDPEVPRSAKYSPATGMM